MEYWKNVKKKSKPETLINLQMLLYIQYYNTLTASVKGFISYFYCPFSAKKIRVQKML